jgi:hypothetical protein
MVGLLAKNGKGCYLFSSIGKVAVNPEQLIQLTTRDVLKMGGKIRWEARS